MKEKTVFLCNECGYENSKWLGRCPSCNEWNSMVEQRVRPAPKYALGSVSGAQNTAKKLCEIELTDEERFSTGIGEFDRVLGGGIVRGSLILVGGDPGIGKSTLLTQICGSLASAGNILYASGEESQKQIKIRADRLGINNPNLLLISETNLDVILQTVNECNPSIMIIDSVQTMYKSDLPAAPGTVSQVREVTINLMRLAKERSIAIFLVGHVTKEGAIAGPRVLEHMVDCVLYFEGERYQQHRILRGVKNRFGSTNEIGVFEMRDCGLCEVTNPSQMLLDGRPADTIGSCVICTLEGTRPILAELQALIAPTNFNIPRRMSAGIDQNRVAMLMAVLEKRAGMHLSAQDAYVNVIGGLKIDEPAADLGLALAITSSFRNTPIAKEIVAIGEVGLTGEIRGVNSIEKRVIEAVKLGFTTCLIPQGNNVGLNFEGLEIKGVGSLREALEIL